MNASINAAFIHISKLIKFYYLRIMLNYNENMEYRIWNTK